MTSPEFNYFYRVELQAVQYTLGGIKNGRLSVRELITRTYNFVSKSLKDAATASDRETYIPILESVGEVTLSAGEVLPSASVSSIRLDDSRGSFGADRRFSDILERFVIVNQPISVYVGESSLETDAPTAWTKIGGGKVSSWSKAISTDRPGITIQIEPFKLSDRVMNIEVSRDITGMQNAPQTSLGKALPIVFNKISPSVSTPLDRYPQVIPTRISFDGAETAKYALCSLMYRATKAKIQPTYYAKKNWADGNDIWTPVSFTRTAPDYTTPLVGTTYSLTAYAAKAYKLPDITPVGDEAGFVVTGIELRMKGRGSGTRVSTAQLDAFLMLVDKVTYNVIKVLGSGKAFLADYDTLNNAAGTFSVNISFDAPSVIELASTRDYDFYIGYSVVGATANEMELQKHNTLAQWIYKSSSSAGDNSYDQWRISSSTEQIIAHKLRIVAATSIAHENAYTKDGYTYASMTLTQPSPDTGQANCDLDSLELVNLVEGFCKYSYDGGTTTGTSSAYVASVASGWTSNVSGNIITITPHTNSAANATLNVNSLGAVSIKKNGSAIAANDLVAGTEVDLSYDGTSFNVEVNGTRVYDPPTVLKILSYTWDGEQWVNNDDVDTTTLASTHYTPLFTSGSGSHRARYLSGISENKTTYTQLISQVASGSASKVGILSNGKLFIYPWGVSVSPAYVIPQCDIIPLSWEMRDEQSIVNRSQITFQKYYTANISQTNDKTGYKYSIDFSRDTYTAVQQITEQSRSLFGAKNIVENTFDVFGFSDTSPAVGVPGYLTGSGTISQPSSGTVVVYSVDFLADYYISRFALPLVYCSFVVPYHRYKNIRMFDIISFHHSEFPAFYGTDPMARPGTVNDGTSVTEVKNANFGEELVRAQTYRGLVESVSYVMAMEHAPAVRLTVQVLLNKEYDPT